MTLQPSASDNIETTNTADSDLSATQPSVEKVSLTRDAPDDSSHTEEAQSTVNGTLTTSTPEPAAHLTTKPAPPKEASPIPAPQQSSKTTVTPVVPALPKDSPMASEKQEKPSSGETSEPAVEQAPAPASAPAPEVEPIQKFYKNWADMARGSAAPQANAAAQPTTNGQTTATKAGAAAKTGSVGQPKSSKKGLADVLQTYRAKNSEPVAFLEPRGLHNSAVDCYINSVSCESCTHYLQKGDTNAASNCIDSPGFALLQAFL